MLTPDKSSCAGCTLPGVFCCSEKGQAIRRNGPRRVLPPDDAGRLPGKPEQNAVPTKGDIMAIPRAGNGFPASADEHHIFSVHTAVPSKGAAGFFYSTHFYLIPGHITKGYVVFGGLPFRGRAPPSCSRNCLTLPF